MYSGDQNVTRLCLPRNLSYCSCCVRRAVKTPRLFSGFYREMEHDDGIDVASVSGGGTCRSGSGSPSCDSEQTGDDSDCDGMENTVDSANETCECSNVHDECKADVENTKPVKSTLPRLDSASRRDKDDCSIITDDLDRRISELLKSFSTDESGFSKLPDEPLSPTSPPENHEFRVTNFQKNRSSSLKSATKKDVTPSTKKVVRFADALGLDLASVRHIIQSDMPPVIPARIIAPLRQSAANSEPVGLLTNTGSKHLEANFPQPGASCGFLDRVHEKKVCLENCIITERTLSCTVRVANIGFHKAVLVRYTSDGWKTHSDVNAMYIQGSCDGPTDRFIFSLVAPAEMEIGSRLEFAVLYIVNGQNYWDNNYGVNYQIESYMQSMHIHNDELTSFM